MGPPTVGCLFVAVLAASLCSCVQGLLYMYVNEKPQDDGATQSLSNPNLPLIIQCDYTKLLEPSPPHLVRMVGDVLTTLVSQRDDRARILTYSVPIQFKTGLTVYECRSEGGQHVSITVDYNSPTNPTTITPSSSSGGGGSSGSNFTGLNPLIYTISAVILLGSLAIVAIITCWIRARRSFNNRSLRSAQTAQDYFDHLSDSEFTPLTSEEFQASLQVRPPTYNQSEQLESGEPPPEATQQPAELLAEQPAESTLSPEDAAIIENLIGLNLLPEEHRRQRRPPRDQPPPRVTPRVMPRPPTEEAISSEGVEELRSVGVRAQQLLTERQSVGQLVHLDPTT